MQEKRLFVAFTPASFPAESSQEHDYSPHPRKTPRSLHATFFSVEEQCGWVRDLAQQEARRLGLQVKMSSALSRLIRALY